MPAKAGTHDGPRLWLAWVLAFARMTVAVAVAVVAVAVAVAAAVAVATADR